MPRRMGHDHDSRFTIALDIELDPSYRAERQIQRDPLVVTDEDAPVRYGDNRLDRFCPVVNRFIGVEQRREDERWCGQSFDAHATLATGWMPRPAPVAAS